MFKNKSKVHGKKMPANVYAPNDSANKDDSSGDTLLHTCIRKARERSDIEGCFENLNPVAVSDMTRTVNNKGQLPLDLVDASALSPKDKKTVSKMLMDFMLQAKIKNHSESISSEEVVARYTYDPDSVIVRNLKFACKLANQARQVIENSYSHPDCNHLTNAQNKDIDAKLANTRLSYHRGALKALFFHPISALFDAENLLLDTVATTIAEQKSGNCVEYCFLVNKKAQEEDKNIPVQHLYIQGGDHHVICIGDGNDKVICDAWAGDVYPLTKEEVSKRLICYDSRFENSENQDSQVLKRFTIRFNENYHRIVKDGSLNNMASQKRFTLFSVGVAGAYFASQAYSYLTKPSAPENKL